MAEKIPPNSTMFFNGENNEPMKTVPQYDALTEAIMSTRKFDWIQGQEDSDDDLYNLKHLSCKTHCSCECAY